MGDDPRVSPPLGAPFSAASVGYSPGDLEAWPTPPGSISHALDALIAYVNSLPGSAQWIVQTADLLLSTADAGNTYSTLGASGPVAFDLPPTGVNGNAFTFAAEAPFALKIYAPPGQTIQVGTTLSNPGGFVESSTRPVSTIKLARSSPTTWIMMFLTGSWSVDE